MTTKNKNQQGLDNESFIALLVVEFVVLCACGVFALAVLAACL